MGGYSLEKSVNSIVDGVDMTRVAVSGCEADFGCCVSGGGTWASTAIDVFAGEIEITLLTLRACHRP